MMHGQLLQQLNMHTLYDLRLAKGHRLNVQSGGFSYILW